MKVLLTDDVVSIIGERGLPLKQTVTKAGYVKAKVKIQGKFISEYVHRLVAKEFIPNPLNHREVNHIDGNKSNNHPSNLEWVTPSENIQHAFSVGLRKTKPVEAYNVETGEGMYYPSIVMTKQDGFDPASISGVLANRNQTHKGYEWRTVCEF